MTKWFVEKGARHIVLISRGGVVTEKLQKLISELSTTKAEILVRPCDITNKEQVESLVRGMQQMPPIKGVIHGAMVLRVSHTSLQLLPIDLMSSVGCSV